jgi:hypothetical protein
MFRNIKYKSHKYLSSFTLNVFRYGEYLMEYKQK